MTNSDVLEKFKSLIDSFVHAGSDPGCAATRYCDFAVGSEDPDNTNDDYKMAVGRSREE